MIYPKQRDYYDVNIFNGNFKELYEMIKKGEFVYENDYCAIGPKLKAEESTGEIRGSAKFVGNIDLGIKGKANVIEQ